MYIQNNLHGTFYFSCVVCCQLAYINLRSAFFCIMGVGGIILFTSFWSPRWGFFCLLIPWFCGYYIMARFAASAGVGARNGSDTV